MVNMTVSPDLEAYVCYAIVLILGLVTAFSQVSTRLADRPGKWIMVNTWLLLAAYTAVPLALFWFLDRTSAIHDTSLFAAILVGVGYQRILAGTLTTVQAPADVSKLWQPFASWADAISVRITDRLADNRMRFDEKLLSSMGGNSPKFEALRHVVMTHAADPKAILTQLDGVVALKSVLNDSEVQMRQATLLYQALKQVSPRQFDYLLHRHRVISDTWYYWYAREWRSRVTALVVALVLAFCTAWGIRAVLTPQFQAGYEVWRVRKDNATEEDRYRAASNIERLLSEHPVEYAKPIELELNASLRSPALTAAAADRILALIVDTDDEASKGADVNVLLIGSLHTANPDIRNRIQKTLVDLAKKNNTTVPADLLTWQPDSKESPAMIDDRIREWKQLPQH